MLRYIYANAKSGRICCAFPSTLGMLGPSRGLRGHPLSGTIALFHHSGHQYSINNSNRFSWRLFVCKPSTPLTVSVRGQVKKARQHSRRDIVATEDKSFGELSTSEKGN